MPCPSEMVPGVSAIHRPTMGMTGAWTAASLADCERARSRVTSGLFPCGAIENAPRPGLRHGVLLEDDFAVDDDRADAGGVAVRLLERRGIGDASRIEHGEIGLEALFEHAAIGEAETLRRKRRHLLDRAFERQ